MIDVPQAGILELFSLAGQRAIVTGGGRGIGRAIAQAFGEAGARAILVARSRDQLTRTAAELPNTVAMPADVTSADPDQLIADCERALGGPIDVIVHAAGSQHREPSVRFPLAEWDRLLRVHLTAPFLLSQALGRRQLAAGRGGSHIFIGSLNNYQAVVPDIVAYGAAKSGVGGIMRALSREWSGQGIRCNGIAPGWVVTELTRSKFAEPEWAERILARIPMGRVAEAREIAGAAVFLASAASSYVTGQMLVVDGGWTTS